jgi:hypothetical protein
MSIYTRFSPDDIVEANPTVVTTGLWSGDTGSLVSTSMYLKDSQVNGDSGLYYFDVYNKDTTDSLAEVQFAVAYGHVNGGGSPTLTDNEQATLATKAIYSQYRNLLLDPGDTKFTFSQGDSSDHFYVINIQRARIREQLDPGNWVLPLSGANGVHLFIDDSGQTRGALTSNTKAGRVYNVVSGSLTGVSGSTLATGTVSSSFNGSGYGLVYPDLGIIILNPNAIGPMVGFFTSGSGITTGSAATSSITSPTALYTKATIASATKPYAPVTHSLTWGTTESTYNHASLFVSMKQALLRDEDYQFKARSAETISSTHYFVRLRNKEYNYSNNPTFYNADTGTLVFSEFRKDPRVYITTVGLYNDSSELLAVAKLSKPVQKSFDEELLLRVRLDF